MNRRVGIVFAVHAAATVSCLVLLSSAFANECTRECKAETSKCFATRCGDLRGDAGRSCRETCRGIGGCANIRTLAYVDTVCQTDPDGRSSMRQTLKIRRGNCAPVTVMELPPGPPMQDLLGGTCKLYGDYGVGVAAALAAPFQRLVVSPDARSVVFEVTAEATLLPSLQPVPPEFEGMWYVRSDGTRLHRLGAASRYPRWEAFPSPDGQLLGLQVYINGQASFTPDSRKLVYTDLGPGPIGEEAPQIWVADVESGMREPLTHLPTPIFLPGHLGSYSLFPVGFPTADTVVFFNMMKVPGESEPRNVPFAVKTDGSSEPVPLPLPALLAGGRVDPTFAVIGAGGTTVAVLPVPEGGDDLFLIRPDGLQLQLTNIHSQDLRNEDQGPNGRRLLFLTPEDPLGTNPSHNCQLFSINNIGGGLRQLTHFEETEHATAGCNFVLGAPGCGISTTFWDLVTGEIVSYSSCDPFGTNPHGGQLFAMRSDGSHLRQLTALRGLTIDADGTVTAELPGPFRYPSASF